MRALTWLLGVMMILLGLQAKGAGPSGWTAVWISIAVLWFFVGCGLGVVTLAKLVSGKTVAGLAKAPRVGVLHSSAAETEKP